jgi:uncharacterized protein YjiS (DUF1127 family)
MAYALASRAVTTPRRTGILTFLTAGLATWRQRRALSRLDAHARRDLGLSGRDVYTESMRPIWNVPAVLLR